MTKNGVNFYTKKESRYLTLIR